MAFVPFPVSYSEVTATAPSTDASSLPTVFSDLPCHICVCDPQEQNHEQANWLLTTGPGLSPKVTPSSNVASIFCVSAVRG